NLILEYDWISILSACSTILDTLVWVLKFSPSAIGGWSDTWTAARPRASISGPIAANAHGLRAEVTKRCCCLEIMAVLGQDGPIQPRHLFSSKISSRSRLRSASTRIATGSL